MIGDSAVDVNSAQAAGVIVGVVLWGYRPTPVKDLGSDFILCDLDDLPNILNNRTVKQYRKIH